MQETDANELSETEEYDSCTKIRLKMVLDICRKGNKKQFCMLRDTKCKQSQKSTIIQNLILFYTWKNEDDLITRFNSYMESYIDKQDIIHKNAQLFSEDCERFDSALEAFENDVIPQSAWDSIVPSIAEEDALTQTQGFDTIQVTTEEEREDDTIVKRHSTNVQLDIDWLSKLYAKVAHKHMMDIPRLLFKNAISK